MTAVQLRYGQVADVLNTLHVTIRRQREARRLSVRAAAKEMGLAASTLSRLERGYDLNMDSVIAALRWLEKQQAEVTIWADARRWTP